MRIRYMDCRLWIDSSRLPILCRDMPKAITIGISLTTVCYLMVNVAYITVLGKAGILNSEAVAVVSRNNGGCTCLIIAHNTPLTCTVNKPSH